MKGVKHYTEDGEYKGETHKMPGNKVHTGKNIVMIVSPYLTNQVVRLK